MKQCKSLTSTIVTLLAVQSNVCAMEIDWIAGFASADARAATFAAGTELIFDWAGTHDVVVLPTKDAFDACDFSDGVPLGEEPGVQYTISETTYFVCTIPGHCLGGQKLAATVTADEPLVATNIDWVAGFTSEDAREAAFDAGTNLVFDWATTFNGQPISHDVVILPTKEAFDACDFSDGVSLGEEPGVQYTISEATYFVCTIPGHCLGGQKLSAMVTSDATMTSDITVTSDAMPDEPVAEVEEDTEEDPVEVDEAGTGDAVEVAENGEEPSATTTSSATKMSFRLLVFVVGAALAVTL